MVFWLIFLGILLFFGFLFSLHLKLYLSWEDVLSIRAGFGPVVLQLLPKKQKEIRLKDFTYEKHQKRLQREKRRRLKKKKKDAVKEAKKKKAAALAREAEKQASAEENTEDTGRLSFLLDLVSFLLEELPRLASYFKTEIRQLHITVGGKDADLIARKYGRMAALTSLLLELLDNGTAMLPPEDGAVRVEADFTAPKTVFHLHIRLKLRLFSLLRVAFHTLKWMIAQKIKENKQAAPPPAPARVQK